MLNIPNRRPRVFLLASKDDTHAPRVLLPELHQHLIFALPEQCMTLGSEAVLARELAIPIHGPSSASQELLSDTLGDMPNVAQSGMLWESATSLKHVMEEDWNFFDFTGPRTHDHVRYFGPCPA